MAEIKTKNISGVVQYNGEYNNSVYGLLRKFVARLSDINKWESIKISAR